MSNAAELTRIVERFEGRRVVVLGDFMLDRYVFGDAERISPEAPVPVLRVVERQDRVGGAGSVAMNVAALGGQAHCFGLLGRDRFGDAVEKHLRDAGVVVSGLLRVDDRPTITKTRLVGLAEHRHRQQILRVDDEEVRPPLLADLSRLLESLRPLIDSADVICLEDYAKGLLSEELCSEVIAAARRRGKPVLVDPPRSSLWDKYRGATLLTPNRAELEIGVSAALTDAEIEPRARALAERLELEAIVVTLGRDGARVVPRIGAARDYPTRPRAVYDNTGAGDAVLAMLAMALACGADLDCAVPLANVAGGLEVSKFGCVPISRDEVLQDLRSVRDAGRGKIRALPDLIAELTARRQRGESVVFTNGCFDLLHPGHVELLERARGLGSLLVVGLNSDASVRAQNKAPDRPIRDQSARSRMLAALEAVDYVVIFEEPTPARLIERLAPDVLAKGADWSGKGIVGREFVESRGGRVVAIELLEGFGVTGELERIRHGQPRAESRV